MAASIAVLVRPRPGGVAAGDLRMGTSGRSSSSTAICQLAGNESGTAAWSRSLPGAPVWTTVTATPIAAHS